MNNDSERELSRGLKARHVQMIAIGGAIGTGLFLGSGSAIKAAGPSLILAYAITGLFAYLMMRAVGELLLSNTKIRSFIDFVRIYLGDKWEFAIGWAYWLSWSSLAMADLTASGIYLRYWFPTLPQWVTPLIVIVVLVTFNLINVKWFGELESWFASIKVFAILALIVVGIGLILTGFHTGGNTASFSNLVSHGGFFATGWQGFIMAFPMVIFAFTGIEMVGLTAGETEKPERDLPKAINSVPIRIGLFYVGAIGIIMSVYPWNQIDTTQSPFVQVFAGLGIKFAATLINFVVLTAALSAANSAIFSTSRTLYVLAKNRQAPHSLAKVSKNMVPVTGMLASSIVFLVVVLLNYFFPSKIFTLITSVATMSFIFVWILIMVAHIKYKQSTASKDNPYKMPWFPATSYATILFFLVVLVILTIDGATRWSVITTILFFIVLVGGYSLWSKRHDELK
ncbi:amino acid permease [Weissella bombi]|uniref:Amino acid/polyamine/organocation transporter, APC superfamily (TC 2.A.3) n=1 Tax=Weissella bombi TaxID=1505725 RepID=A0A1C3ZJA3_9LACO|nr:amino acid permease [Weissella bombi]SCB82342.1 amino acid/polyamine/organocation transporter, APC superfamily (TC 2.A.3) [Weissella bombi]